MSCQSFNRAAYAKRLSFISPAKINLFFRILYKRADGFHEIASLYQAINLCDALHIIPSEQDVLTCSDPSLAMDEKNLVCKALSLFREKTGILEGVSIHLEKKIPMQAGLGGGSSNAAATLFALNQIFSAKLSQKDLEELGAFLGSDVPFFFSKGTAYCTGRGEKLQEMPAVNLDKIWIAKPAFGLSTPLVYGACKPSELPARDPLETLNFFYSEKKPSFYNDLEVAAFSICPGLALIKQTLLESGFHQVVLCGSGTAFFCIGDNVIPPKIEGMQFFETFPIQDEILRSCEI